jgi:hypothetical protein
MQGEGLLIEVAKGLHLLLKDGGVVNLRVEPIPAEMGLEIALLLKNVPPGAGRWL